MNLKTTSDSFIKNINQLINYIQNIFVKYSAFP